MRTHKCNFCGNEFNQWDEQEQFGLHYNVGYGSEYDGCEINIDLCCGCFDAMMKDYINPKLMFKDDAIKGHCNIDYGWYTGGTADED